LGTFEYLTLYNVGRLGFDLDTRFCHKWVQVDFLGMKRSTNKPISA